MTSPPQTVKSAFTLVEIVVCLAIISSAILAVVALLPLGSDAGREASDKTIIALILEDIHKNLEGKPLAPSATPLRFNYDGQAKQVDVSAPNVDPNYLVEVSLAKVDPGNSPDHTAGLFAARISLYWPVDPITGDQLPADSPPDKTVTYYVTTMTSPSWETVDPNFSPKIEF